MNISATAILLFTVSGNLSVSGQNLQSGGRLAFSSSAVLTVKNQELVGAGSLRFSAAVTPLITQNLTGYGSLSFTAKAESGVAQLFTGEATLSFRQCAELDAGRDGLGACDVIRHILLLWGVENPKHAPAFVRSSALDYMNAAMQAVWNSAKDRDYWTRTTHSITLAAGASFIALQDSIQNVIGPARLEADNRPLVLVNSRSQIDHFVSLYMDGVAGDSPVAYYIERTAQAGKEPTQCVFRVAPAPEADTDFLLDVIYEAPRFTWNDVDACPRVPIPHRYVESLLLPIARYHAMSSHLFVFPDRAAQITEDYQQALTLLDAADPLPPATANA